MEVIKYAGLLVEITKAAVEGNKVAFPADVDFKEFFAFAKYHKLENMLYKALVESEISEEEKAILKQAYEFGVYLYVNQDYNIELITDQLKKRRIRYMLLKGSVLRQLYISPDMRQSADIDILIDKSDAKEIKGIMEQLGFETKLFGKDQDVYTLNNLVNVEMHRSLLPAHSRWYPMTQEIIKRSFFADEHNWQMTKEDFYLFNIIHMAKHISEGGIGIKAVLDIWIYLKHYKTSLDMDKINERLMQCGLMEFEKNVRVLSGYWFDGKEKNEITDELISYIVQSGWNGREEVQKAIHASAEVKGKRIKYWFKYVFMSPKKLSKSFKILDKYPFLVGFVWIYRLFMAVFVRKGAVKNFIHRYDGIETDEIVQAKEFIKKIGL